MYWKDSRLRNLWDGDRGNEEWVVLNPAVIKHIWHPDIYIGEEELP